jgi:N-acyl-D-amino-acid deacylase
MAGENKMYDTIIKGGTVIDGSGSPRFQADIAILGDRIAGVGDFSGGDAKHTIDASGYLVTPGWVDVHTHYDGQATWDPILAPSSWHGVTTTVMGNCGVGFAPVRPGSEQFLIELMEGVEDIPGTALAEGINWQWEHFPEYLDALEQMPRAIDVATHVPHAAVRAYVMGERCNTDALPSDDEVKQMAQIVSEGVAAGALGFSTSRTLLHKDIHGVDVPGTHAPKEEMLALGLAMKGLDHGVFELVSDHLGEADELEWVTTVARETGRTVTLVWTSVDAFKGDNFIELARSGADEGLKILPQVASRPTGILHGLQSSFHIFVGHPTWFTDIAPLPFAEQLTQLQDPAIRARMLAEGSAVPKSPFGVSWADLLWYVFPLGVIPNYEPTREQSVAGIAEAEGRDPFEVMYDLLVADGGKELFYQPLNAYENYDFSFFESILEDPDVLFGLSDGGAHCGIIADAGMPTHVLTHWGRDRKRGRRMELELLVRKLSRDTAVAYGMNDRGLLQAGYLADINIIDFEKLQLHRPEAIFDLPAGGKRLVQRVDGYRFVLKSGVTTFVDGEHTGELPGRLVRGAQADAA